MCQFGFWCGNFFVAVGFSLSLSDMPPPDDFGRKDFLPVEPQGGLSFLFRLSEPRFA